MILPKEKVLYENLNTSFTSFSELLTDLKLNHFTGVVHISFWDYEGVLFMDSGEITNALEDFDNQRRIEQEAINGLLNKVKEKNGIISVYALSSDLVTMLAGTAKNEIVYKDLTSDFTDLGKLLEKLESEQHTGYIELLSREEKHIATIFLHAGEPVESIISAKETTFADSGINPVIFDLISENGAVFNVYKAWFENPADNLVTEDDMQPLIKFWEKVILIVDRKFEPSEFIRILKETLIAKADSYPFLDPFAAEFNYVDGKIEFTGEATSEFSKGIAEVLSHIISNTRGININSELKMLFNSNNEFIETKHLQMYLDSLQK